MANNRSNRSESERERVRRVQELRRSGAASPVRNRRKYRRVDAKREVSA